MNELSYKELQIKAKELGMDKVVGISAEDLKKFIDERTVEVETKDSDKTDDELKPLDDKDSEEDDIFSNDEQEILNVKETEDFNKNLDSIAQTRGFKNYQHIKDYLQSKSFKSLSVPDQEELKNWFKNI